MDALRKCWKHSLNAFFALALSIFTPAEKERKNCQMYLVKYSWPFLS